MESNLFIIEISTILAFMFVGILYVPGKNPETQNEKLDLGNKWCRGNVQISSWIHSVCALGFMVTICTVNTLYAQNAYEQRPKSPWAIGSAVWAVFSIQVGIAFITVQGVLYYYNHLVLEEQEVFNQNEEEYPVRSSLRISTLKRHLSGPDIQCDIEAQRHSQDRVELELVADESEDVKPPKLERSGDGFDRLQIKGQRILARKLQYARVLSFVLEFVWVSSLILHDGFGSIFRNTLFPHFGQKVDNNFKEYFGTWFE